MHINAHKSCYDIAHKVERFIKHADVGLQRILEGMTLHIGPASVDEFKTPAHARDALFVGDGAHIGTLLASTQLKAAYAKDPKSVTLQPIWNSTTEKFDMLARPTRGFTGDADFLSGQQIAPWNQSWFSGLFKRPLLYSHASDLVSMEQGNKPWAEVMNLAMEDFAGFGIGPLQGGADGNNDTNDITVQSGFMSAPVVNLFVTYSLSAEEVASANAREGNPYGKEMIADKIAYSNYCLQLITDYLTYFGNSDTDTVGLFNVNSIENYAGDSLETILAGASDTKGSDMYEALSGIINKVFNASGNKFDKLKVGVSVYTYNVLTSTAYSKGYEPKSVLTIFNENYLAGTTKDGKEPKVEFFADPMLDALSDFNSEDADYMVITAPEIGMGPNDEKRKVILQGMPLKEFIYPVVPGQLTTQHRVLRKYAGIFCPVKEAVHVVKGFGKKE